MDKFVALSPLIGCVQVETVNERASPLLRCREARRKAL